MKKPAAKKVKGRGKNPGKLSPATVERFRLFHDFDPRKVIEFPVPSRSIPREMVVLGDLEAVVYRSDKWTGDGKKESYIHEFKKSRRPLLCCTADGKQLFIIGGCYHVEAEGIVD